MQGNSVGCWSFVEAEFQEVSFADSESEHGYSGRLRCDFNLVRHCNLRLFNATGQHSVFARQLGRVRLIEDFRISASGWSGNGSGIAGASSEAEVKCLKWTR